MSSIPGSGRSPGGGHDNPLQYSCLENPMDRGDWWATVCGSQRVGHDWAAKHTSMHTSTSLMKRASCLRRYKYSSRMIQADIQLRERVVSRRRRMLQSRLFWLLNVILALVGVCSLVLKNKILLTRLHSSWVRMGAQTSSLPPLLTGWPWVNV